MQKQLTRTVGLVLVLLFLGISLASGQGQPGRTAPATPPMIDTPTNEWAVVLQPGSNAAATAQELGFVLVGGVGNLPNTYVLRRPGSERGGLAARSAALALANSNRVVFYQQQFIRQHSPMDPNDDPLYASQWHLNNTGQFGGTAGQDAKVQGAWNQGFTGAGVQVAVVDDGVEYTHPDLSTNYTANGSRDYAGPGMDDDPFPGPSDAHGTSVAGVIAAEDDATCGVGAAYEAKIAGIRTDFGFTDAEGANMLSYGNQVNDLYNNSWGWNPGLTRGADDEPLLFAALADNAQNGRGGLGNIYTFAAGNSGNGGPGSGENANRSGYNSSRYTISVAASTNGGTRADYSEFGTPVLLNAPSSSNTVGIYTTDRLGSAGYNMAGNASADCTDDFGGTSSATPLVSGIIALMLDANPNLTWRDVQYILAQTATKNDPTDAGWFNNNAGYHLNILYGFGRANASYATWLAKNWVSVPSDTVVTSPVQTVNAAIPDSGPPLTSSIIVAQDIVLEHVEVVVNIDHPYPGDVIVNLTSPSGTVSQLMTQRSMNGGDYLDLSLMSVHHWGESSKGVWTLTMADGYPAADTGTWDDWQLKLYGVPKLPNDGYNTPTNITSLPFSDTVHTAGSTHDAATYSPSCGSGNYRSVWYSFTPESTGDYLFETTGSSYDTVLSIWDGSTEVACNDNVVAGIRTSVLEPTLTAGTNYRVMVNGYAGAFGRLNFVATLRRPTLLAPDTPTFASIPVLPTFSWMATPTASYYRVFVRNSAQDVVLDETFVFSEAICVEFECQVDDGDYSQIPWWGLKNGNYEWWVGAWDTTYKKWFWSKKGTFSVAVSAPTVTNLVADPQVGSPLISWDDDPNTAWVRLVIEGNGKTHEAWYERDGAGNSFTCTTTVCSIQPAINWPGGNYTVKAKGWGPGGVTDLIESTNNPLVLPGMPQNILVTPQTGRPLISWDQDDTTITHVQIYIGGNGQSYKKWHNVAGPDITCNGSTCSIEPDINWPGGNYNVWLRGWAEAIGVSQWTAYVDNPLVLPGMPQNISADARQGRPLISWDQDDTTITHVRVYIGGNGKTYSEWHIVAGPDITCNGSICSIEPAINWPGGNYNVWLRGYAASIGASQWASSSNNPLVLPGTPPAVPTDLAVTDPTIPSFSWDPSLNATWYQVVVEGTTYQKWLLGYTLSEDCGNAVVDPNPNMGTCNWSDTALTNLLTANVSYSVKVKAWNPNGESVYTANVPFTYSVP